MKIMYFRGQHPNFGDELNLWMWPKLLPGFFDEDERILFIGIGSILGEPYPKEATKIVFGTGFVPQYHFMQPEVTGDNWKFYFVRGPRTAKLLNLPANLALGDSAILLRTLVEKPKLPGTNLSFMPHWESLDRGHWEQVCARAGLQCIDPRWPVEQVIAALQNSRLVITEAMHGAIIADALRIPWIALLPIDSAHREKWFDWADALKINLTPYRLWPSGFAEMHIALKRKPLLHWLSNFAAASVFSPVLQNLLIYMAAWKLKRLARVTPNLSGDKTLHEITEQMLEKLQQLKREYQK